MKASPRRVHPAALATEALLAECDVQRTRRSGPGGQHRNKVETAIVLKHRATGVEAAASERRSQSENLSAALFRLRVNLALEVRCDIPVRTDGEHRPSELWRSRCRNQRIAANPEHEHFPALLAEVLDVIHRYGPDLHDSSNALQCTRSQLVKFLKLEPRGMAMVNRRRTEFGLQELR